MRILGKFRHLSSRTSIKGKRSKLFDLRSILIHAEPASLWLQLRNCKKNVYILDFLSRIKQVDSEYTINFHIVTFQILI